MNDLPKCSGIYCIEHITSSIKYIGSSKNIYIRTRNHLNELRKNKHINPRLQNAWNKYGEKQFKIYVLELCLESCLLKQEQLHIDSHDFNKLFNANRKADKPPDWTGKKRPLSTREKMKIAQTGRKISKSTRAKMSRAQTGKKRTRDSKLKASNSMKVKEPNRNSLNALAEQQIKKRKSVQQLENGKVINTFLSLIDAQEKTGINSTGISLVCRKKQKSAGGFQWQYAE